MLFFSHAWLVFVFDLPYISFHERSHIMKVNGIVAEYNPFHNGHAYQMQHAKEATGADYTIVVMSGNFWILTARSCSGRSCFPPGFWPSPPPPEWI